MDKSSFKVYYIYHSGFALETETHLLVFDYFKEPGKSKENSLLPSLLSAESIKGKKEVFVFSSHSHRDHFNPTILEWNNYNPHIKYILSEDITTSSKKSNYLFMKEQEEHKINNLYVKTFGSTDLGVSFLVKVDDLVIFHAGDLNWWHWKEDSLAAQQTEEINFKIQIEKLKAEENIHIAFFPVDPRLDEFYYLGGEYFVQHLQPKLLIPMHFGDDSEIPKKFSEKMRELNINETMVPLGWKDNTMIVYY